MLGCASCGRENADDARFCEQCGGRGLAPVAAVRPKRRLGLWAGAGVAVLGILAVVLVPITARSTPSSSPLVPRPNRQALAVSYPFNGATVEGMSRLGAQALALHIAAGNTEVVQSILQGPMSLTNASRCDVAAHRIALFDDQKVNHRVLAEFRRNVDRDRRRLEPRAEATATASIPEGVVVPYRGQNAAKAIRVTVLLSACEELPQLVR